MKAAAYSRSATAVPIELLPVERPSAKFVTLCRQFVIEDAAVYDRTNMITREFILDAIAPKSFQIAATIER
jgi:hypothetical protein